MKTSALILVVVAAAAVACGQETVNFANLWPNQVNPMVNAPVYESDGVTKLSGSQFTAELLAGPTANNLTAIAMTGFLTGNGAGYFNGGTEPIPNLSPGMTAWVQVNVWNTASGSSFAQAQASGLPNSWWASSVFSVALGGGVVNPTAPATLTGLGTSPVYLNSVPEPSALALVGCGMVLVFSRKGLTRQSTE
jgi:hypothetical protein